MRKVIKKSSLIVDKHVQYRRTVLYEEFSPLTALTALTAHFQFQLQDLKNISFWYKKSFALRNWTNFTDANKPYDLPPA